MDYKRVYNEFISDRKSKDVIGYSEKHHIIPKALGGSNAKNNLIILSASDHLFAHLLLAKIHGGMMWFALKMMLEMHPNSKKTRNITNKKKRYSFETMRKNVALYYSDNYSGNNSALACKEIFMLHNDLQNRSIDIAYGTISDLREQTGLQSSEISALKCGTRMSAKGFYYKKYNPKGLIGYKAIQEEKNKNIYYDLMLR